MKTTMSPETNLVAIEELEQLLDAGEPWPVEICDRLGQLPSGVLRDTLRLLKIRTRVRRPFLEAANLDPAAETDLHVLLRQQLRRNGAKPATTITYVNMLLKWQFHFVTQNAADDTRRKLWHTYQVQMQPACLRQRMRRFLGLTFLPGRRLQAFEPGEPFVPLSFPRVLSLAVRPHRLRNGTVIDMFDVKLHLMQLDVESGAVIIGGPSTVMSKYFNFLPSHDPDRLTLAVGNVAVVDGALALHEAMEQVAIDGIGAKAAPVFPDVYLGFGTRDQVGIEYSESLQRRVLRQIDAWFRRGRPTAWPELPGLAELRHAPVSGESHDFDAPGP